MSDSRLESHEESDVSSDGDGSQSEPELMITTRARRTTAGNRYSQVVAQEQAEEDAEDDVALLFADVEEEDEEYNSDEADDEADMSSSDDDDQGPNAAAADDMEGEEALAKQAKAERQKKRKADMAMTTLSGIRKKPKIDPTALHRAPEKAKPSKRKERQSWIPDENATSGRTSLRKQTVAHRAVLYERLKETEEQRLKNKAIREEKEKQKQADAPKEMTQADRLAEAEKIERRNAKSLNRWETLEKQRAEEQAAKLAALKDRKLNGPVLTFHSAVHVYRGPKVEPVENGAAADGHVYKKRGPKPKAFPVYQPSPLGTPKTNIPTHSNGITPNSEVTPLTAITLSPAQIVPKLPDSRANNDWLAGIHEYASIQSPSGNTTPIDANRVVKSAEPDQELVVAPGPPAIEEPVKPSTQNEQIQSSTSMMYQMTPTDASTIPQNLQKSGKGIHKPIQYLPSVLPIPVYPRPQAVSAQSIPGQVPTNTNIPPLSIPSMPINPSPLTQVLDFTASSTTSQSPAYSAQPVIEVTSTRNLVILQDFEDLAADARQAFNVFYGTKKPPKPTKHVTEICTITGLPAKYRDPKTGTSYANSAAYKKLQQLRNHGYTWSSMLGCYVGKSGFAARGVPEGFLTS